VQQYRELKDQQAGRMAQSLQKLEKIKEFRKQMKVLADEARERAEFHKQLVDEYERVPKDVQRSQYTDRIMEIVKNVKKQNLEIERVRPVYPELHVHPCEHFVTRAGGFRVRCFSQVLQDTRTLQKEISGLLAQLGRIYAATDELVYKVRRLAWSWICVGILFLSYYCLSLINAPGP